MCEKLLKTVTNLGSSNILLVGDFMLDSYVYGDAFRISPEAPVPVLKVVGREYNCGGAASVAANIAAMEAVPICIGIVGDDANGQALCETLKSAGADITALLKIHGRPTTYKERLVGLAQHRHRQQLMRIDQECTDLLNREQKITILKAYKDRLSSADVVCLQDYNKGLLSEDVCAELIDLAKKEGKKILVDPAAISDYSKYTGATIITPNRTEAAAVVGFDIDIEADAARAAQILVKKLKLEAVLITLDKEGIYLKAGATDKLIPTIARMVYDVTGAGDMILASMAFFLAAGCDYKTATEISNIAGGIEVGKFGCTTVTISEIANEIVSRQLSKADKIQTIESLILKLDCYRSRGKTIVFTNGCFDVLHRGHIEYLRFCKEQGDIFVLGLNSDNSVRQLKGTSHPINTQHDRAAVLASLESIDYIVIFDDQSSLDTIVAIKPDVLIKGRVWEDKVVIGQEFVEARGGKLIFAPLFEGKSLTAVVKK